MKELKALLHFAKPYRWWLTLATTCMVLAAAMDMAGPWMIRSLIDTVTNGVTGGISINEISRLALIVLIVYIVRAVAQFGNSYISHYSAWNIIQEITQHLYNHLQKLSLKYYQDKRTGELMSVVINDTRNFEQLLAHAIPTIIVNSLMIIGVSVILFVMNPMLALYSMIPIPVLVWMVLKFSSLSRPRFKNTQTKLAEVNSILQDNFTGIREIKSFTKEEHESRRICDSVTDYTQTMLGALLLSNSFTPGLNLLSSIGTVIVIFFGGRLAVANQLSIADMVAFLLYLSSFYQPIMTLGQINEGFQQALGSAERVLEVLSEESEITDSPDAMKMERAEGQVEFRNVSFRYVEDIPVLKNISFEVRPGEMVALVGPTGVGKTTIANLIPRFYDPNCGEILIDNIDIRKIKLSDLRKQVSFVSQDVFLFNGTIKENILYGHQGASDEDIISAAKAANAHEFIVELPDGYDTKVGERGVKLSGGQKQRISIARAVLKDAPILVLDEATSAVDTQTEKLIQEALNKLKKNKTTVVIAHRLSTIQQADQIIVIKDGRIVEKGKHVELLKLQGLYSQLCKAQNTEELMAV
jgi:ABC-type multidrug transport system, ATPase and permease components